MTERHRALIVEDDPAGAENLKEILVAIDCESDIVGDRETARRLVAENRFCLVLLDLAIKGTPDALKDHQSHGLNLLQEIRKTYGPNRGVEFWTPIVVISGYANEPDMVIELMRESADDVIRKPLKIGDTTTRIRRVLEQAGRQQHLLCMRNSAPAMDGISVQFTAEREKQRAIVLIAGKPVPLPVSSLKLFLELALARERGEFTHKRKLGWTPDHGYRAISRLRSELRPALPGNIEIIDNNRKCGYALKKDTRIIRTDLTELDALGYAEISRVARELIRVWQEDERQQT
jgi:DNA-binding response OmpR family regulator